MIRKGIRFVIHRAKKRDPANYKPSSKFLHNSPRNKKKSPAFLQDSQNENGADTRIRTGDLILTNLKVNDMKWHFAC